MLDFLANSEIINPHHNCTNVTQIDKKQIRETCGTAKHILFIDGDNSGFFLPIILKSPLPPNVICLFYCSEYTLKHVINTIAEINYKLLFTLPYWMFILQKLVGCKDASDAAMIVNATYLAFSPDSQGIFISPDVIFGFVSNDAIFREAVAQLQSFGKKAILFDNRPELVYDDLIQALS